MAMELLPSEFYSQKEADRKQYETRAEEISALTLPYAMRKDGQSESTPMEDFHSQSYCGRAVNTLKAKMGMALLPPATSSFRITPSAEILAAMSLGEGSEQEMANANKLIAGATTVINAEIENQQIRESLFEVIVQLILVGSCIVEKIEGDGVILHTLKNYVVELDRKGRPTTMCIKEVLTRLPDGITVSEEKDEYELYTMLWLSDEQPDTWVMTQDIEGEVVGQETTFKTDKLPFKYLGWTWMQGSEKGQDMQIVAGYLSEIKRELASSFLLNESATRDAERVTAEEVRFMAQELETSSLAGIYSKLSRDWSGWLITQIMNELKLEFGTLEVNVITGLDALGRNVETQKLDGVMARLGNYELTGWIKEAELVSRIVSQQGVDSNNLIKTPDEKAQEEAQAQQAALKQQAQASVAESSGNIAQEVVKGQQKQAEQAPQQ